MFARSFRTFQLALKSLALHKLRSGLTVLGVVFGVGSVIMMLAIGEGARLRAIAQIRELGATNIIVRSVKPTEAATTEQTGVAEYGLTRQDLQRITQSIPTVLSAAPAREDRKELRYLDRDLAGRVVGVQPVHMDLNGLRLREGRFITALDNDRFATVAVIAAGAADALFPYEDPVGRSVRIGENQYFQVVGVTEPRESAPRIGSSLPAQDYNFDLYIPYTTDKAHFGELITYSHTGTQQRDRPEISQITVAVDDMQHVKKTAELIQGLLAESHKQNDTAIAVPLDLLEKAEQTQRIFSLVLGSIASISLLVGGIGIMNIMLATVTERTREIGIRRALGATRRDITRQFLLETVVLSGAGGFLGVALGVTVCHLLTHVIDLPAVIRLWALVLAFTISVLIGIVFGTYPARRAALMDPIEALRHE